MWGGEFRERRGERGGRVEVKNWCLKKKKKERKKKPKAKRSPAAVNI